MGFLTNDACLDQWAFGPITLFRTSGPLEQSHTFSDQWFLDQQHIFGPMGFWTDGFSDRWVIGPIGRQTIDIAPGRDDSNRSCIRSVAEGNENGKINKVLQRIK